MTTSARRLRSLAQRLLDARTVERTIEPALGDWESERLEALQRGRPWARRWVALAGWIVIVKLIVVCSGIRLVHLASERTEDDRSSLHRALMCGTVVLALTTVALVSPYARFIPARSLSVRTVLMLGHVIPSALALTIPIGLTLGVLYGVRVRSLRPCLAVPLVAVAAICCVVCFVLVAWVVPASNQTFRAAVFRQADITKGSTELTLRELGDAAARSRRDGQVAAGRLSFEWHTRIAMSCATFFLALGALAVAARPRSRHHYVRVLLGLGLIGAYYGVLVSGRMAVLNDLISISLAPLLAWLPNLLLLGGSTFVRVKSQDA